MKSGFVALIGRPNVGKSTLLNEIMQRKIAITSPVSGTTRNIIEGIYNDDDTQIVFVDTPGIHKPENKLGKYLNEESYYSISNVDVILLMMDITKSIGSGDKFVINSIKDENVPVILVLNKIDKISYQEILPKIDEYSKLYSFSEIIPISASSGKNIDELIKTIKKYLTDDTMYYDKEVVTNISMKFLVSELIREKVLELTRLEVPHSVTVLTEDIIEDKKNVSILAYVIVDRESLKKILIGKGGSMIKKIGIKARYDIENVFNKKVYLDLKVKVVNNWRDNESSLKSLGFTDIHK